MKNLLLGDMRMGYWNWWLNRNFLWIAILGIFLLLGGSIFVFTICYNYFPIPTLIVLGIVLAYLAYSIIKMSYEEYKEESKKVVKR